MTDGDRRQMSLQKLADRAGWFTGGALILASLWFTAHSADIAARKDMIEDAAQSGAIRYKGRAFHCSRVQPDSGKQFQNQDPRARDGHYLRRARAWSSLALRLGSVARTGEVGIWDL